MYMNMANITITIMIMKNMSIIMTMNADVDMITITKNMSIIMTMNADADMITITKNMSIITTMTMNVDADMIIMTITIIMQMKYLQAGVVRQSGNLQEKILRKCLKLFLHQTSIILRAKGMLPAEDGTWIYFDMVPEETEIREGAPEYTGRLCVIGSKLKEDKLAELFGL